MEVHPERGSLSSRPSEAVPRGRRRAAAAGLGLGCARGLRPRRRVECVPQRAVARSPEERGGKRRSAMHCQDALSCPRPHPLRRALDAGHQMRAKRAQRAHLRVHIAAAAPITHARTPPMAGWRAPLLAFLFDGPPRSPRSLAATAVDCFESRDDGGRVMGAHAPSLERPSRLWSRSLRAASREPLPPPPPQGRRPYPQWRCSSRWRPSPPPWRRLPSPQGWSVRAPLPSAARSFVVSFVACC